MATIPSISSTTAAFSEPNPGRIPVRTLSQDDFLKLLVAQLTAQDPLNPKTDTEFIAQMAQFSALEQSKSMQSDIATLQANAMIGRVVEMQEQNGTVRRGTVEAVQLTAGTPHIVINGQAYELNALRSIEPAATP